MVATQLETRGETAPGPRGDLLLGSTLDLKENPLEFVSYVQRAYGDVARFRIGPSRWYLVSNPADIWDIMVKRADLFPKPKIARRLWDKFLGKSILTEEGESWKRLHRLMRPAFHRGRIAAYGETMVDFTHRMVDGWQEGQVVDVDDAMVQLTLEIVAKTLFDADVRAGADKVGRAMHVLNEAMLEHIYAPIPVPRWWPSETNRRKLAAVRDIEEIVLGFIAERRQSGEDRGDLLSMLIQARTDEDDPLTDREVRDQAMTLFFAGHETTAHAMTWTWYLLARHPEVTRRLQEDLDAVTGGSRLEVGHLAELPYLDMVVKESMRILPSVWVFMKEPTEDVVVGGYRIPKGSQIMISPYVVQHDARWFASPETFDPERFSPERIKEIRNGAYIPFSGGARVCIGKSFAMMEERLVVGSLLQRLTPEVPEDHVPIKQAVLSMQPKGGLPGGVRLRAARV